MTARREPRVVNGPRLTRFRSTGLPRVPLTTAEEHERLLGRVTEWKEQRRREKFWEAVQDRKQPGGQSCATS